MITVAPYAASIRRSAPEADVGTACRRRLAAAGDRLGSAAGRGPAGSRCWVSTSCVSRLHPDNKAVLPMVSSAGSASPDLDSRRIHPDRAAADLSASQSADPRSGHALACTRTGRVLIMG